MFISWKAGDWLEQVVVEHKLKMWINVQLVKSWWWNWSRQRWNIKLWVKKCSCDDQMQPCPCSEQFWTVCWWGWWHNKPRVMSNVHVRSPVQSHRMISIVVKSKILHAVKSVGVVEHHDGGLLGNCWDLSWARLIFLPLPGAPLKYYTSKHPYIKIQPP